MANAPAATGVGTAIRAGAARPAIVPGQNLHDMPRDQGTESVYQRGAGPDAFRRAGQPENVRRWLKDPQAVKPGCHMPDFHLSPDEVNALAAYLETMK